MKYIYFYIYNQQHHNVIPHFNPLASSDIDSQSQTIIAQINNSICTDDIKTELIAISNNFRQQNNFIFHTDGSVLNLGTQQCSPYFGWLETHHGSNTTEFKGSTVFLPSSAKAEAMAILTTIFMITHNSHAIIYTDSANCINTFNKHHQEDVSPRRQLDLITFLFGN